MKKLLCCLSLGVLLNLTLLSHAAHAITLRGDQEANFDGLNLMDAGQYDKAIEKFTLAIETTPKERQDSLSTYYVNRGVAFSKAARVKEALSDLDKAVALNPDSVHGWAQRASVLYKMGRYAEADLDAGKALLINTHDFVALNARGLAEVPLMRYEDAISDFTRALALKQDPIVYINRAGAYREQKAWSQALGDYETALQIKPNDNDALLGRATIQWHMKRYDAVISGSEGLLKTNETALLRVLRGMAHQSQAHWQAAVAEYDAALVKEPELSLAAALRELARRQLPIGFGEAPQLGEPRAAAPPLPETGEIRLQGTLKSADKAHGTLTMEATAFTLPGGKTAQLSPAKQKEVAWNPQTQILPYAGAQRAGAIDDIKPGAAIWAIGPDKGTGTALAARRLGADQQLPEENKPAPDQAAEPKLPVQAFGHPRFVLKDKMVSAGTAFLARWDEGDPVLLTAHHLLGPAGGLEKEIPHTEVATAVKSVRLNDFMNRFSPGEAKQAMPLTPVAPPTASDESGDMEAFRFAPEAGKELTALPLAAENAAVGEPLWLVGRAQGEKRPGTEGVVLYPARAVLSEAKQLMIQMKDPVPGRGFSGAPVVNAKGEVVGMMLSSSEWLDVSFFVCNPVSAMRARLKG
jgi:tetratricopeptide (TPR) repeat protein